MGIVWRIISNQNQSGQIVPQVLKSNAPVTPQNNSAAEVQQFSDAVSGLPSNVVAKPTSSDNASLSPTHNLPSAKMLPPGNAQALQISQGDLPGVSMPARPQEPDPQPSLQQQWQQQQQQQCQQSLMQQQPPQFQRSPLMLAANPLLHMNTSGQNSNMPLGNHMVNKPSPLQLQLLQQQQPQMQRKMIMGLGTAVGMGNMGNNMVGLGGLGNVMGMGVPRGMGGTGISAPMGSISGMGNVGQSPMNPSQSSNISNAIGQQLCSGALTPTEAQAIMAIRLMMAQNRTNMRGGPQSSIGAISGARQMHPGSTGLSMLGQTLNWVNINPNYPMQRTAMGPMGPPKLTGMNLYMNQQQQQQQQQQLQLQQQMQQQIQQQFQQQRQETASLLQAVVSPQVGSPSTMGIPQQLNQ